MAKAEVLGDNQSTKSVMLKQSQHKKTADHWVSIPKA
jgi:hypothetical protein